MKDTLKAFAPQMQTSDFSLDISNDICCERFFTLFCKYIVYHLTKSMHLQKNIYYNNFKYFKNSYIHNHKFIKSIKFIQNFEF